jgi:hypothetical protein
VRPAETPSLWARADAWEAIRRMKKLAGPGRIFFPLAGACIFLLVFSWSYSRIPGDFYQTRDDGVITMSHARNWVEYGVIGVGPSGERVEGTSAPLQFFLFSLVYRLSGIDYALYAKLQTIVFTLALGLFFMGLIPGNRARALALTALAAVVLARRTSFFEWHGSGLENAITHALFLASALVLIRSAGSGRIALPLALIPFLASISRLDGIVHMGPVLVVFTIAWRVWHRDLRGLRFALVVLALWGGFQAWRFAYFGDLLPNTAYGQGISVLERARELARFSRGFLTAGAKLSNHILALHGATVLLPFLPLALLARRDRRTVLLLVVTASLAVTAYLHPFLFGRTTLDPARATTHLAPCLVLLATVLVAAAPSTRKLALSVAVILPLAFLAERASHVAPGYLCCSVGPFEAIRAELLRLATQEDLPRPTIANPDLGAVSWHKDFNVIDLGGLGSPIVAQLRHGPLLADYFFEAAAPDLIETHGAWSRRFFGTFFSDPRFVQLYVPAGDKTLPGAGDGNAPIRANYWIRKDIRRGAPTAERELIDDLRASFSVARLERELDRCRREGGRSSLYVARTAYRFLPEIIAAGHYEEVRRLFTRGENHPFARYLIEGRERPGAYREAVEFLAARYLTEKLGPPGAWPAPVIDAGYRVYRAGEDLIYIKDGCSGEGARNWFFVEIEPADGSNPERVEFSFRETRYHVRDRCLLVYRLPSDEIRSIRTGEFLTGGTVLWEGAAAF